MTHNSEDKKYPCSPENGFCGTLDERIKDQVHRIKSGIGCFVTTDTSTRELKTHCHGVVYKADSEDNGLFFNFCPWCGQSLAFMRDFLPEPTPDPLWAVKINVDVEVKMRGPTKEDAIGEAMIKYEEGDRHLDVTLIDHNFMKCDRIGDPIPEREKKKPTPRKKKYVEEAE